MDRRSWLWRRKSSDKSSGETESLGSGSGSMSSPSERFSDEQQVYSLQNAQSPELNSKHADRVKILSEKLSAATATINEKEELVKQHAKVAEEAVTGWERAENEMNALKQQLDDSTMKNSALEEKIASLDGALKECLRQLRQVREEQDRRNQEAVAKEPVNLEFTSSELQCQLDDFSAQLELAKALETELRLKLASFEKENTSLQLELNSKLEALELMTLERDLSTKRAETASKQHLESIKRVTKLEGECRVLKAKAQKGTSFNGQKSTSMKTEMASPSNIGLLDDFVEVEKLASVTVRENNSSIEKGDESVDDNSLQKTELEEKIEMLEAEKVELGLTLRQCQGQLDISESRFRQLEAQLNQCQNQLKVSQAQLKEVNKKVGVLQDELHLASELRQAIDLELDDANVRRENAETHRVASEKESKILMSKVTVLEDELFRIKNDVEEWQNQLALTKASKEAIERELRSTNAKKEALESQVKTLQAEIKSLLVKISYLESKGEKERSFSEEREVKCRKLENELSSIKHDTDRWRSQLASVDNLKEAVTRELKIANAKKEELETQLEAVQGEAKSLLDRVRSLEHEMQKERTLSVEFAAKCKKLEEELLKMKSKPATDYQFVPLSKEELSNQQEKELAIAASKLAECQKTIASLGNQLKSLATFEDLFQDLDKQLDNPRLILTC